MSDSELIKGILERTGWTQEQLAGELLFNRSQVSRLIHGKITMRPSTRKKAEELLKASS